MKRFVIPLIIMAASVCRLFAAPAAGDDGLHRALDEIRDGISAAVEELNAAVGLSVEEIGAAVQQSLSEAIVELDEATVDRLIEELGIPEKKRTAFKRLYRTYRRELTAAIDPSVDRYLTDANDEVIKRNIKGKLKNISATAEVKRSYVDKFSAVLSADQIRRLYNIEGQIAAEISGRAASGAAAYASSDGGTRVIRERRSTFNVNNTGGRKIRGSGRLVERDFGTAGDYKTLKASNFIRVRISGTAKCISVSTDDNVLEFVRISASGGVLSINLDTNGRSFENVSTIVAVVPASPKLCEIKADGFANVESEVPVGTYTAHLDVAGHASVKADVRCTGEARFDISGFGSYLAEEANCGSCRVIASGNSSSKFRDGIEAKGACSVTLSGFAAMDGNVDAAECTADLASNTRWSGDIDVSGSLIMKINGFARHKGSKSSESASLTLSGNTSSAGSIESGKTALSLSGFANVEGSLECTKLSAAVSGNSRVNACLDCTDFSADVSGFSSVTFKDGTSKPVASAFVTVSGNSTFAARSVPTVNCKVVANGFSRAEVNCTGRLTIEATRQSNVYYTGGCTVSASLPDNIRKLR